MNILKQYNELMEKQNGDIMLRGKNYSEEYKAKLVETYNYFKENGYNFTEHALNRILGRMGQGKIFSIEDVLDTLTNGKKYQEPDGTIVRFKNNLSVHIAKDNGDIKTVIARKRPKPDWREIE
ncbi:hypothetical protein Tthe_2481 [Thermoanaerobacterium thermosaccharolyticum DSM 571]|uniref:Uncharacterized protein n=1 Tax=Thermoanaerobacterium thermosaccharolyticum (strain ATCC 7956 / DSM 571 / NCIMB 9385 / NCA 3814 / NCTC 13789 / WDCM 00135 / 2032) TaxID=580327 RepID=D9TTP7_THETC|nr:hypothetical protein [Thermoanaerobacterium thermosaccharolyticum]ADL69937.1 hypothetical protein Tthe_2481 [Thermoanaerobacterium thermosaccharolyticum DSM 571]